MFSTLNLLTAVRFHGLEVDRTGTPIEALSKNNPISSEALGNIGAVQAGTGITSHISFPAGIRDFGLDQGRTIDRAELIINPIRGSIDTQSPPPNILYFSKSDASGLRAALDEDEVVTYATDHFGSDISMDYVSGGQTYGLLDITHYIEELANGETDNTGLIISPREQASSTVNHFIFGDTYNADDFSLELRVFYTEFQ